MHENLSVDAENVQQADITLDEGVFLLISQLEIVHKLMDLIAVSSL
jgi:hypothetical protein